VAVLVESSILAFSAAELIQDNKIDDVLAVIDQLKTGAYV
jgi:hypothetical protein